MEKRMKFTPQDLERAKARKKAKEFINKIPYGMAIKMSDEELEFLDSSSDIFTQAYFEQLNQKAQTQTNQYLGILWERK